MVTALGSDSPRKEDNSEGSALIFQTVCHNPAHTGSYKLYYYPDHQTFHCYTQCSESFDLYELVMRSRKCSFFEALRYIQIILGLSAEEKRGFFCTSSSVQTDDWDLLNRYALKQPSITKAEDYPALCPVLLDYYTRAYPVEWLRDGISKGAMDRYHIRFSIANNEIIIPHYDLSGRLIGIRSRSLDEGVVASGCKYMPTVMQDVDFRHALRGNLYGLNVCKDAVVKSKKILLAESEKSAMQSYTMYGDQSFTVALCGSNITLAQRDMILSLGVKEVFIGLDKEYREAYSPESDLYADKLLKRAGLFTPYATTYLLFDTEGLLNYKDSPTDKGQAVLERLMKNKFEIETSC